MVISGPSGVGKGTVVRELLKRCSSCRASVSATTRSPRKGEKDGEHYYFLSRQEFEQKIKHQVMLEYEQYNGNYYGTPKDYVRKCLEDNLDVVLEIEVKGALKVKKQIPNCLMFFLKPPSLLELEKRLRGRGTESEAEIAKRLKVASWELDCAKEFDFVLVNDNLEQTVSKIAKFMGA